MKVLFSNILLLLTLGILCAQPPTEAISVSEGVELNLMRDRKIPELFGHDERGYYAHSFDYRDGIVHFDHNFNEVVRERPVLFKGMRSFTLRALFHFHDSLYMFTSEQKFKRMILYLETIDKETMKQNGDRRVLMDAPNMSGWMAEFGFKASRQEKKLLVFSRTDVLSKKVQDLHFEMYGEGFEKEWEADQRVAYPRRPPRESIVKVNERGDVFMVSLQDEQRLSSRWKTTKNRYRLFAITDNGKYNNTYTFDFPELYIRSAQIEPGENHDLSICGFYSPTHYEGMIDGVFYMELDNESEQFLNQRFHEFEPWFLEEALGSDPRKDHEEMYWFEMRHMIRRKSGNFIVLAENEYDQDYDTYQNIVAMSFSPGGSLNWKRVVPKIQGIDVTQSINYSSYQVHAQWEKEKIYLVFNDNIKNGAWPDTEQIKSFHPNDKAILKIVSFGELGETSSSIIYRKTKRRMKTPVPLQYYDMLTNEFVIPSLRYKKYKYLKISFNE